MMGIFMKRNFIRLTLFVLVLFNISGLSAQISVDDYQRLKDKYKGESVVQLQKKTEYDIDIEKGELVIYVHEYKQHLFLKNSMGQPFKNYIYTSSFYELEDFEANSYVLDGKKYKQIPVKTYTEKTNSGDYSFYDDVNELMFTYPGIGVGTVVELKSTLKVTEPRLLSSEFLQSFYPTEKLEVVFNYDADIYLDIIDYHVDSGYSKIEAEEKGRRIVTITRSDIPYADIDDHTPNMRYFEPHIIPIIRSYQYKGKTFDILPDNSALYKWYYSFLSESKEGVDEAVIKKLADSLTVGCVSDFEKVEVLYYWVQKNIKYIAFEFGTGGFIPRKPDDILRNKYGDCKDKSSLLHELTRQAGVTTYFTWIGTRDIPYSYADVSSPVSDNHMILTYIDADSNYYFLDGTARYNQIHYPTSFIQGKEAMIGISESVFQIKEVPTLSSSKSIWHDSVMLRAEEKCLVGAGELSLSGYQYIQAMHRMSSSDKEYLQKYYEGMLQKGNNKFKLLDYGDPNAADFDTSLSFNYHFKLDNYVQNLGDEFYVNLNLNKDLLAYKVKEDRKQPISFNHQRELYNSYVLEIPANFNLTSLPENVEYHTENFGFEISYKQLNNEVIYKHAFYIKSNLILQENMGEWQKLISELENAYKQTIMFSVK